MAETSTTKKTAAENVQKTDAVKGIEPKRKNYANSLWIIILPLFIFILLGVFVAVERAGIELEPASQTAAAVMSYMPEGRFLPRSEHQNDVRCLVICNSAEETYGAVENITWVLNQMSVGYTVLDISKNTVVPNLDPYKTMIMACTNPAPILLHLRRMFDWVTAGGGLLFTETPENSVFTYYFFNELGIQQVEGIDFVPQVWATLETDLLAGGKGVEMQWSEESNPDQYRMGGYFYLQESAKLHMSSSGPYGDTPMLWENRAGLGRVVVNNNDAVYERWSRGFIAAMYSLTEPVMAYPVINASVIFIDDFPSPVPEGRSEYINRDYGVTTDYFMVQTWFPNMLAVADKYNIKYSGVFIETYRDHTSPVFDPEPMHVNERMKYFGALFLNAGHEVGMHGYNHQSLVLESFDYEQKLEYKKWPTEEYMVQGLNELTRLYKEMFPGREMRSYVPPSNVLSVEGRAMLKENFPNIRLISGLLVDDLFYMEDDFGVAEDGLINFPRYTSGFYPFDDPEDYTAFWSLLCEMNLHLVNSHFIHPDDTMDVQRGASRGWASMLNTFDEYLAWVTQFPIRQMTAEEAGPTVERFDSLVIHTSLSKDRMVLNLDGFYDEAWMLIRINDGVPAGAAGGALTKINDSLYLLKAESPEITINLEQAAL